MADQRMKKAKLNISVSLLGQFVALICGLIGPRLLISKFGSEAYGATASIAQFLSYITLLEAGIGGVARAALYKPLAENDNYLISAVVSEIKRYFRIIGCVFIIYVVVLACSFKQVANVQCFDWITTALLVVILSVSTFAQYFIGISYSVLLQAAQRTYITKAIAMFATILNTVLVVVLIKLDCNLLTVKLVSSVVFALKPFFMWVYVRKYFRLTKIKERNPKLLEQKWSGLGQHLAFYLHSNTDVAILTLIVNLSTVSIYSVYHMVVSEIQKITSSFSTGMEAIFGDMLAKKEIDLLKRTFSYYETFLSFISVVLFSVTAVMIIPFVKLYTADISDVNYIQPVFALLMVIASLLYCLRIPYHAVVIAAGHFRQTRTAAYGEAIVNVVLSMALVGKIGLVGVALGTVIAVLFRMCFYAVYLSKNILFHRISDFVKRLLVNGAMFLMIAGCGLTLLNHVSITGYITWIVCAAIVGVFSIAVSVIMLSIFYRDDLTAALEKVISRRKRRSSI